MTALELLLPNRTVENYVIQGLLGRTPWATTYAGFKAPEGHVAIKLLSFPETAATTALDELEGDLLVATQSLSPSDALCPRDAGEDEASGLTFIVTPLCAHPSLFDLATTSPLAAGEVAALLTRIGRTLSAGVPHLGLRPNNVFVGPPPDQQVLLSDFGFDSLRRAHLEASAGRSNGTPLDRTWLAPEQGPSAVSHPARVDVYCAALLAVFALSSAPLPCDEHGAHRVPLDEHAAACGVSIPPEIVRVLARALAVDPLERFETVAELADAFAAGCQPRTAESRLEAEQRHARATGRVRRFRAPDRAEVEPASRAEARVEGAGATASVEDDRTRADAAPDGGARDERPRETKKVAPAPSPQHTVKMAPFKLRSNRPSARPTAPPPPGLYGPGALFPSGAGEVESPLKRTQLLPRFHLEARQAAVAGPPTDGAPPPSVHEVATVKRPRFTLGPVAERLDELGARRLLAVVGVSVFVAITSTIVAIVALLRAG